MADHSNTVRMELIPDRAPQIGVLDLDGLHQMYW